MYQYLPTITYNLNRTRMELNAPFGAIFIVKSSPLNYTKYSFCIIASQLFKMIVLYEAPFRGFPCRSSYTNPSFFYAMFSRKKNTRTNLVRVFILMFDYSASTSASTAGAAPSSARMDREIFCFSSSIPVILASTSWPTDRTSSGLPMRRSAI